MKKSESQRKVREKSTTYARCAIFATNKINDLCDLSLASIVPQKQSESQRNKLESRTVKSI